MRVLSTKNSRTLWLGRAVPPYAFVCPTDGGQFALFLVVADDQVEPDVQRALSEQFVRSGCRHAVCFGPTSSSWDDSIDMVWVRAKMDGRPAPFVMTSWFDRDPLHEAVDFFADHAACDDWVPDQLVALVLGGPPELEADVRQALLVRFG